MCRLIKLLPLKCFVLMLQNFLPYILPGKWILRLLTRRLMRTYQLLSPEDYFLHSELHLPYHSFRKYTFLHPFCLGVLWRCWLPFVICSSFLLCICLYSARRRSSVLLPIGFGLRFLSFLYGSSVFRLRPILFFPVIRLDFFRHVQIELCSCPPESLSVSVRRPLCVFRHMYQFLLGRSVSRFDLGSSPG